MPTKGAAAFETDSQRAKKEKKESSAPRTNAWEASLNNSRVLVPGRLLIYYASNIVAQLVLLLGVYSAGKVAGLAETGRSEGNDAEQCFLLFCFVRLRYQVRPQQLRLHKKAADATKVTPAPTEKSLKRLFKQFDQDGSGSIDAEELQEAMERLGHEISMRQVKKMISDADVNGDGEVDYAEFTAIMGTAASDKQSMWVKADQSLHGIVAMMENQKWHAKNCFIPVAVMIICAMLGCCGIASLLYHYATKVDPCALGIVEGFSNMDTAGILNLWLVLGALAVIMCLSLMLSLTHFKIYKHISMHMAEHQGGGLEKKKKNRGSEASSPLSANRRMSNSGPKPTMVWYYYFIGVGCQCVLFLIFSLAKNKMETLREMALNATAVTVNSSLTNTSASILDMTDESHKLVFVSMHLILTFNCFHIGHQLGQAGEYRAMGKEIDFRDPFWVQQRVTWHGSMIYRPCFVAVLHCFFFFSLVFQLLPFYRQEGATCHTDFIKNLGSLEVDAFLGLFVVTVAFGVMQASLIMLCVQHFRQFQKYTVAMLVF